MTPPRQFPDNRAMPPAAIRRACELRVRCGLLVREIAVLLAHEYGHRWDTSKVARVLRDNGLASSEFISPAIVARWREAGTAIRSRQERTTIIREAGQLAAIQAAEEAATLIWRCECGGYRSTPPDGMCVHGRRTREGIAA